MHSESPTERPAAAPWGRLLLTAALPLLAYAAQHVLLPGIDGEQYRNLLATSPTQAGPGLLSVVALGLTPILSGFLIVEVAARLLPRWRALRSGAPAGRQVLRRAALALTLGVALVQGF